ncbi:hypothetical protein [Aliivibrio fischeri]|nr:hypothetical protein [Aliivibrio fischeri]
MRVIVSIFGFFVFGLVSKFGMDFLEEGLLSGAELTVLLIAFAVIGLILYFSTEIQEFSVGGNIVKLRQVKEEAEQSILDLKAAQIENFRLLISLAKRHPGGISAGNLINDSRVDDFWMLYDQIEKIKDYEVLANDLIETLELIMKGQLLCISGFSDNVAQYRSVPYLPEPDDVMFEALDPTSVQQAVDRKVENGDSSKIKAKLKIGISTYRKLYELSQRLKKKI